MSFGGSAPPGLPKHSIIQSAECSQMEKDLTLTPKTILIPKT